MTDLEILGNNIKKYRLLKGMTQTELAERVGMSSDHLSKIEATTTGNVGLRFLTKLRQELDVELFQLFMENPEEKVIKFVISDRNFSALSRLVEQIIKRFAFSLKRDPAEPIFYHREDCQCEKCKEKGGEKNDNNKGD